MFLVNVMARPDFGSHYWKEIFYINKLLILIY